MHVRDGPSRRRKHVGDSLLYSAYSCKACSYRFFAPTILHMVDRGLAPTLLYVTTGNSEGLGRVRSWELRRAVDCLGVSSNDTIVMDVPEFEDGLQGWDTELLALIVEAHATERNCNCIVTFDEWGVSFALFSSVISFSECLSTMSNSRSVSIPITSIARRQRGE